ncbi:MAG TPA: hypothetical protein VNX22_08385, partial [Acidobacteriaceae bacterium]|nr:hypothetical protein [Acidobacteriaceae bacterium]
MRPPSTTYVDPVMYAASSDNRKAAKAIRERGAIDVARINAIEAEVRHDVIAFTTAVAEKIGPESRWL